MKPGSALNSLRVRKNYGGRNEKPFLKMSSTKLIRDEREKVDHGGC